MKVHLLEYGKIEFDKRIKGIEWRNQINLMENTTLSPASRTIIEETKEGDDENLGKSLSDWLSDEKAPSLSGDDNVKVETNEDGTTTTTTITSMNH